MGDILRTFRLIRLISFRLSHMTSAKMAAPMTRLPRWRPYSKEKETVLWSRGPFCMAQEGVRQDGGPYDALAKMDVRQDGGSYDVLVKMAS